MVCVRLPLVICLKTSVLIFHEKIFLEINCAPVLSNLVRHNLMQNIIILTLCENYDSACSTSHRVIVGIPWLIYGLYTFYSCWSYVTDMLTCACGERTYSSKMGRYHFQNVLYCCCRKSFIWIKCSVIE